MMRIIEDLAGDWRRLDERIEGLSADITSVVERDPACERLMTVPGIGPIISSATVAAIGTGDVFSKVRDFAAWLGLVPRQLSTGDRTILGKISRRGNRYLRVLFVQAAWVVLIRPQSGGATGLRRGSKPPRSDCTITCLRSRLPINWPALRWAVLNKERYFEVTRTTAPSVEPA
jgi:transposase